MIDSPTGNWAGSIWTGVSGDRIVRFMAMSDLMHGLAVVDKNSDG